MRRLYRNLHTPGTLGEDELVRIVIVRRYPVQLDRPLVARHRHRSFAADSAAKEERCST